MWRSLLVLPFVATPALAEDHELTCTFTTECYEADACEVTQFSVTFAPDGPGFTMSADGGDRPFTLLTVDRNSHAFISSSLMGAVALFSVLEDGAAFYTEHWLFDGGYTVTFHGSCEASP